MDEVVARRARAAGFSTPDEFVSDSMERILAEDAQHEVAVLEGLRSEIVSVTPSTYGMHKCDNAEL